MWVSRWLKIDKPPEAAGEFGMPRIESPWVQISGLAQIAEIANGSLVQC